MAEAGDGGTGSGRAALAAIERQAALLVLVDKVNEVTGRGAPGSILVAVHIVSHRILTGDIPVTYILRLIDASCT
jgi:hypothetical protein